MTIGKIKEWLCRCECLRHPLILLLVSGIGIFYIQQTVLIKVNREEKRLDRKYEILTECSSIPASIYHEIWNLWYGVQGKESIKEYRSKLQSIFVEANSIGAELPILFNKQEIANNWDSMMEIYQAAQYPITRTGISEPDLNAKLKETRPYLEKVIRDISTEIKESE